MFFFPTSVPIPRQAFSHEDVADWDAFCRPVNICLSPFNLHCSFPLVFRSQVSVLHRQMVFCRSVTCLAQWVFRGLLECSAVSFSVLYRLRCFLQVCHLSGTVGSPEVLWSVALQGVSPERVTDGDVFCKSVVRLAQLGLQSSSVFCLLECCTVRCQP